MLAWQGSDVLNRLRLEVTDGTTTWNLVNNWQVGTDNGIVRILAQRNAAAFAVSGSGGSATNFYNDNVTGPNFSDDLTWTLYAEQNGGSAFIVNGITAKATR